MTHPSQYIHTHHPRRGSMTPLGLNVISPVSPIQFSTSFSPSPMRSVGFSPSGSAPQDAVRRESVTSSSSTLTQSRPASSVAYPSGFNRERRRSSLTPSQSTLAPASPSRTLVTARISRPSTSEGSGPPASHGMARTGEGAPSRTTLNQLPGATKYGRRGSLPHLTYGGWTGPQTAWNPSLPPQRGSVGEDQPDEGFKFGSGVNVPSAAAAALRAVDISPGSRRGSFMLSSKRREDRDAFEDAEAEEAERQRRAFLAATYGGDAKRARERLSIGGPSTTPAGGSPGTSSSTTLRRPSLALWEKMHMSTLSAKLAAEVNEPTTSASAPVGFEPLASLIDPGPRRGSLPIAIPGGRLGRSPSRRMARAADLDAPPKSADSQGKGGAADDDADDDIQVSLGLLDWADGRILHFTLRYDPFRP